MSDLTRRTDLHIELGLLPMSGEVVKHRQFMNGVPTSYLSVNLNYVLPQDLDVVVEMLRSEMETVSNELEETRKLIS